MKFSPMPALLVLLATVDLSAAAPKDVTFENYRPTMGFNLHAGALTKDSQILYAIDFRPSFGIHSGAVLEFVRNSTLLGNIAIETINNGSETGNHPQPRLAAFSLTADLAKNAVLILTHDEDDLSPAAFSIKLSAWPVKLYNSKNHPHPKNYKTFTPVDR